MSKSWFGTLNNYTVTEYDELCNLPDVTYAIIGKEIGKENNTPHLQMCISFSKTKRLSAMKKINKNAHWEIPKSLAASRKYCEKDNDFYTYGSGQQGKRTDLENAIETMKEHGIYEMAKTHPAIFVKYHKGISQLKQILEIKNTNWIPTTVTVLWGPPGSGKSRKAREMDPELYNIPEPINGSVWFDGYLDQKTLLFDDFYGWVKYHTLLQYLDGYPMQIPIKGGFVNRKWNQVIITSNKHPTEWYQRTECQALMRRINTIIHCNV